MYKYFPHRSERVRSVHNEKQDETMEDMGKSVPNIYASLDNMQFEFQSHMIEVEGKINNRPIAILIDSGASHSYLDPKMMEWFQFPRNKLGKPWMVQLAT
jgi:predicted aspartyl protease